MLPKGGSRMRELICLNGEWDFMPLYDQPWSCSLPSNLVYEERKVQVPSSWRRTYRQASGRLFGDIPEYAYAPMDLYDYPKEWDQAEAGVLHRSFQLPDRLAGQRIVLRLDGVMQKAAIYLDYREIAIWEDGYLPLRVDITPFAEPGRDHHLHIIVGSFDQVRLPSGALRVTGLVGSWFGSICRGIWQDAYVESYPALSIEDMTIRTSVREGKLEVEASAGFAPGDWIREPGMLRMRLSIKELGENITGNQPVSALVLLAEREAESVDPSDGGFFRLCENSGEGAFYRASFTLDWKDASLWSPDAPFLYLSEIELLQDGQVIDRCSETFGFREFWCEGPRFVLNGIPINLRGDSWHFQGGVQQTEAYIRNWYRMCRSVGVNAIRLHAEPYPADYVRIADEEGMLIVDETAIYGSGKSMQADHPDYLENCRKHVRRLVKRDKNHPSVILWSVQNEMRWVDGRECFKGQVPGLMAEIRKLDPTRPILAEGDNRLLTKAATEVESRHYNIDGTIEQWDRSVPLIFGEHGGWWYICPQNSSMYIGLAAYRGTDESTAGFAWKERLFVEYARRQDVSGISTFNFAHYFMRAIPEEDVILSPCDNNFPGVKHKRIPAYSLTLNNGLLPEGYPPFRTNPAFAIMAGAFKPAALIAAEYNRCFYDDELIQRRFDVYNDTLAAQEVRVECLIRQGGRVVHAETFEFVQDPAERKVIQVQWAPERTDDEETAEFTAQLKHGGKTVDELLIEYRILSARLLSEPVTVNRAVVFYGSDRDFDIIKGLIPACSRADKNSFSGLGEEGLLIIGSQIQDADGGMETALKDYVSRGGRLLLLEQSHLTIGKLSLSRKPFIRAHAGDYGHPILAGIGDKDLMFWHEELREEGPLPIIHAAFEKPILGDFGLLLECSNGDFGDGGDLWSPLLEYRSGRGMFIANQLDLMANISRVPQACLLLRNLLVYAGRADDGVTASLCRTAAFVRSGGAAAAFLDKLRLDYTALGEAAPYTAPAGAASAPPLQGFGLMVAEACMLEAPGAAEAVRRYAEAGGRVLVLPAEGRQQAALERLLERAVRITPHETYHLAANYGSAAVRGFSPVDLFGFDKVFLSPREVVNRLLATHSIEAPDTEELCHSIEGTAWKDYFVNGYTSEYSRLALVELNRKKAVPSGCFMVESSTGKGFVICSQLLPDPESDKALRLYSRLLANLGAVLGDGLLSSEKSDAEWAVEAMMALPCPASHDFADMKAYFTDPAYSLNNLGEGLYGWMQKKERHPSDGTMHIANNGEKPWFLTCFVHIPDREGSLRPGRLRVLTTASHQIYLNGGHVSDPVHNLNLKGGINRLVAVVYPDGGDFSFGIVFLNRDGTYMKDLEYRMTLNEVEPK